MHRPALRSALELASRGIRPSVSSAPASSSPALFSTSSSQSVLKWVPSSKERQAQAASELSSLDNDSAAAKPPSQFSKEAPSEPAGNRIISVRSLPRSGSGPRFPGTGVSDSSTTANTGRFRSSVEGGNRPRGGARPNLGGGRPSLGLSSNAITSTRPVGRYNNRGGAAARGRLAGATSGPRRVARAQVKRRPKREGEQTKRAENLTEEQEQELNIEAREWLHFHEFGQPTAFEPALTREGLLGYSPAVASTKGTDGVLSTALRSMRLVGGGKPFAGSFEAGESHTDASPNPEGKRDELHENKAVFFDTMVERVRTERALRSKRALAKLKAAKLPADTPLIQPVSAVTKAAITEAAVLGLYEGPSSASTGIKSPVLGVTQRYQSQDYTYSPAKAAQFEAKIRELMPKAAAAAQAGAAQSGKAAQA